MKDVSLRLLGGATLCISLVWSRPAWAFNSNDSSLLWLGYLLAPYFLVGLGVGLAAIAGVRLARRRKPAPAPRGTWGAAVAGGFVAALVGVLVADLVGGGLADSGGVILATILVGALPLLGGLAAALMARRWGPNVVLTALSAGVLFGTAGAVAAGASYGVSISWSALGGLVLGLPLGAWAFGRMRPAGLAVLLGQAALWLLGAWLLGVHMDVEYGHDPGLYSLVGLAAGIVVGVVLLRLASPQALLSALVAALVCGGVGLWVGAASGQDETPPTLLLGALGYVAAIPVSLSFLRARKARWLWLGGALALIATVAVLLALLAPFDGAGPIYTIRG